PARRARRPHRLTTRHYITLVSVLLCRPAARVFQPRDESCICIARRRRATLASARSLLGDNAPIRSTAWPRSDSVRPGYAGTSVSSPFGNGLPAFGVQAEIFALRTAHVELAKGMVIESTWSLSWA